jgi:hypothetical protein
MSNRTRVVQVGGFGYYVTYHPGRDRSPQKEQCCAKNCWKDPSIGFWEIFENRPKCTFGCCTNLIYLHSKRRSRRAYGVPYQWLTETTTLPMEMATMGMMVGARCNGYYNWALQDGLFKGLPLVLNENALVGEPGKIDIYSQQKDPKHEFGNLFGDNPAPVGLPSVEQVHQAGGSILYDIIFYGGCISMAGVAKRNHRTAKGTLTFSVAEFCPLNYPQTRPRRLGEVLEGPLLKGDVWLDPCMELLDPVPHNGNFCFYEEGKIERIRFNDKADNGATSVPTSASVLNVRSMQFPGGSRFATGEIRMIRHRTAALLCPETDPGTSPTVTIEEAEQMMQNYQHNKCLWMQRHTNLPAGVVHRIGEFVSPPPVFFLEEGDLVLDMDWGKALWDIECADPKMAVPFGTWWHNAYSTFVFRRRCQE